MIRLLACTSAAALLAAMTPGAALAQDQAGPDEAETPTQVGDIIVTARRREEAIRDVPGTITAVTSDQLEEQGPVQGTGDLLQSVPGVRFNGVQAENLSEVSVRGSGTQRATSADSGVGLFVNGAYVGSSTLGGRNFRRLDYFDLARVEVLEGPQGALYGRNSEFGTVNIVLARPMFHNGGRLSATYTNELEQIRLEGIVNRQLSDTVAARFGIQYTDQNSGQFYNPNQDRYYDHTEGTLVRGQFRYNSGPLDVTFLLEGQDMELPTFALRYVVPPGRLPALPLGYTGDIFTIPSDVENSLEQTLQRGMILADYDLGWGTLTSTTMVSRFHSEQNFAAAVDLATEGYFQSQGWVGLYPLGGTTTDVRNETFYQDVHIAGEAFDGQMNWLVGAEVLRQDDLYIRDARTSPCVLTATAGICGGTPTTPVCYRLNPGSLPCPATFPLPFGSRRIVPSDYQSEAIYGSVGYSFGDFDLTGELRYSHDEKVATQTDFRLYTTTQIGASTTYTFDENNVSYALTGTWRITPGILAYARTGSGYRAGGVNNGTPVSVAPNPLQPTYGNEETTSYEIGIKADLFDNLFLRVSAYQSETENAIASVSDGCTVANVCGVAGSLFNINGGTAEVRGIEASLDAVYDIGPGRLVINVNGARQDAEWTEVVTGVPGAPILGSMVAQQPEWTFSANLNYRRPITPTIEGFFNIAYNGSRGGGQDTVTPTTPFIPLEDVNNVDLRFGADFDQLTLAFFVANATDEVYPVLKLQQLDIPLANRYNRPRTTGVSLIYRF